MAFRDKLARWLERQRAKNEQAKDIHRQVRALRKRDMDKLRGRREPEPDAGDHPGPYGAAGL